MVSSDDFTNADVRYEQSFSNIRASLTRTNGGPQEIPIVTGFLARGEGTGTHFPRVTFWGLCTRLAVPGKTLGGLSCLSLSACSHVVTYMVLHTYHVTYMVLQVPTITSTTLLLLPLPIAYQCCSGITQGTQFTQTAPCSAGMMFSGMMFQHAHGMCNFTEPKRSSVRLLLNSVCPNSTSNTA